MHVAPLRALALALVGTASTAWAQSIELGGQVGTDGASASADASTPDGNDPPTEGADQFTLPKGKLFIEAAIGINLSKDAVAKPISLSPDIWYGVTDDLTLGLVHSSIGSTGLIGNVQQSLCLTGEDNGCPDVYSNVGIDARYRLAGPLAIDGGVYVRNFDPFQLALKLGLLARHRVLPQLALEANPNVFIGVTKRDGEVDMMGNALAPANKEMFALPITAGYAVVPKLTATAQIGVLTPFEDVGDNWSLLASLGARYRVNHHLDLGLAFALPRLAGGGEGTGIDARTLTLGVAYAL